MTLLIWLTFNVISLMLLLLFVKYSRKFFLLLKLIVFFKIHYQLYFLLLKLIVLFCI